MGQNLLYVKYSSFIFLIFKNKLDLALKSLLHITSYKSQTFSPVKVLQNNLLVTLIKRLNSMLWYFSLHRPTIILNNLLELLP